MDHPHRPDLRAGTLAIHRLTTRAPSKLKDVRLSNRLSLSAAMVMTTHPGGEQRP
jgi:hypothetical protein